MLVPLLIINGCHDKKAGSGIMQVCLPARNTMKACMESRKYQEKQK